VAKRATMVAIPVLMLGGSKGAGWETLESDLVKVVAVEDLGMSAGQALNDPEGMLRRATVVACRRHSWTSTTT